jgi:NAD(P)-dependent dehydrogenase (short-subunit alcohol dehydrogenase family)
VTRVFITGSADGLGRAATDTLVAGGHQVVVHARNADRLRALRDLTDRGAGAVVGDLSDLDETSHVAEQVNRLGRMDAVIHNAGVVRGPAEMPNSRPSQSSKCTLNRFVPPLWPAGSPAVSPTLSPGSAKPAPFTASAHMSSSAGVSSGSSRWRACTPQ